MRFSGILIGSEDPARLTAYYTKVLGAPQWVDDAYSSWLFGESAVSIGPHSEVHGRNAHPGRIIWNLESDDVPGDFERFKAAGATVVAEPYTFEEAPGSWIATFSDPDDNYFQLMSPMGDPNEWSREAKEEATA